LDFIRAEAEDTAAFADAGEAINATDGLFSGLGCITIRAPHLLLFDIVVPFSGAYRAVLRHATRHSTVASLAAFGEPAALLEVASCDRASCFDAFGQTYVVGQPGTYQVQLSVEAPVPGLAVVLDALLLVPASVLRHDIGFTDGALASPQAQRLVASLQASLQPPTGECRHLPLALTFPYPTALPPACEAAWFAVSTTAYGSCEACDCHPLGATSNSCAAASGQCHCRPGIAAGSRRHVAVHGLAAAPGRKNAHRPCLCAALLPPQM
jgi:hypothetical protein